MYTIQSPHQFYTLEYYDLLGFHINDTTGDHEQVDKN